MTDPGTAVAVYPHHSEAEAAIKALQKGGFDMQKLSIVGADYQSEEDVVGFYNTGDRMSSWGRSGAFWGAIWGGFWGLFLGAGLFIIPGIGPILAAGPIVAVIVSALAGCGISRRNRRQIKVCEGLSPVFGRFWSVRLIRRALFSTFAHTNSVVMRRLS